MTISDHLRAERRARPGVLWVGSALLVAIALCWLALQRPFAFALDIGGALQQTASGQIAAPVYDAPYLLGVHDPEPATLDASTTETYRWSYPQATIRVPGLSGAPLLTTLNMAPPPATQPTVLIRVNQQPLTVALQAPRALHLLVPSDREGTLTLDLSAPTYQPPNDARELGVRLDRLLAQPVGARLYLPWRLLGVLSATLTILAAGALLSALSSRQAAALVLASGVAQAIILSLARTALTTFAWTLLAVSGAALGLLLLGRAVGGWAARSNRLPRREIALVAGLTALAFGLRLAGLRHPQANYSDLQLHVHNLEEIATGRLIFSEGLPCRAGGGRSPYPPGMYLLLLLWRPLLPAALDDRLLIQAGNCLLDALTIPLLWAVLRLASRPDSRVPLLAALLYLLPLPMLRAMNIGEFANVGAQAMALPAVLGLSLWVGCGMAARWRVPLLIGLIVAALSHSGVLISVGLWGVSWWLLLLAQRRWRAAGQLALLGTAALAIAGLLYYSAFLGDPNLRGTDPNCPLPTPLLAKLRAVGQSIIGLGSVTPVWLLLLSALGLQLAPRALPTLALPLRAWFLAALLSLLSLLWSEQTVRWQHFLYPAICIAVALPLAMLYERPGWQRWAGIGLIGTILLAGLIFWVTQIAGYRTGQFI